MVGCSSESIQGEKSLINFQINENDFHNDLIVTIPSQGFTKSLDTYYFSLDNSINNDEGYEKARKSLVELLNNWIIRLNDLKIDSLVYLPIDFSDQYIGGFKCQLLNRDSVKLEYGFSHDYGYGVYPSNPKEFFRSPDRFEVDKDLKNIVVGKNELIESLKLNIERIK